jgi:hypothetical protein
MNQSSSCDCVHQLVQKGESEDETEKFEHLLVCQEIARWYRKAGNLHDSMLNGKTSKQKFRDTFRQCIALKRSQKGMYTRMVDMLIPPVMGIKQSKEYVDELGVGLYENVVL